MFKSCTCKIDSATNNADSRKTHKFLLVYFDRKLLKLWWGGGGGGGEGGAMD